jgi:hypothetical protein
MSHPLKMSLSHGFSVKFSSFTEMASLGNFSPHSQIG